MSWRSIAEELVPPLFVRVYRQCRSSLRPSTLPYYCPACRKSAYDFEPLPPYYDEQLLKHGYIHSPYLVETINRRQFRCPRCKATDRDRLYALFLEKQAEKGQLPSLLDIAPSGPLKRYIESLGPHSYRTADLSMRKVDDVVDITNMDCYEEGSFGAIICSHVLEHVPDDGKAMRELYRVLAPGGWAILMVPINLGLEETCEDPSITDPGLRWKYFGQDDHVRIYSKHGFVERLTQAGFKIEQYGVEDFGSRLFERCGVTQRSVLYVGFK